MWLSRFSLAGWGGAGGPARWRLLCYHAIPASHAQAFRNQLQAFQDQGVTFCSFAQGLARLARREAGPCVTVTFDDGDATVLDVAAPILADLRAPAMLYLTTDYVIRGETYRDDQPLPAATWPALRDWLAAGHDIGSHTHTHAPLSRCSPHRLAQELQLSKQIIRDELGVDARHLSYPWGQHDAVTRQALASMLEAGDDPERGPGWQTAATIDRGWNRPGLDPLTLRRDVVDPAWPISRLQTKMAVAGWRTVYRLQRAIRPNRGYWDRPDADDFQQPISDADVPTARGQASDVEPLPAVAAE